MMIRRMCLALLLVLAPPVLAADAETNEQREVAAARLFDVPLYRELATREIYEALGTLPDAQRRQLSAALRDPKIVQALKQAILRSTAASPVLQRHRRYPSSVESSRVTRICGRGRRNGCAPVLTKWR